VVAVVRLRSELQSSATDAADTLRAHCLERLAAYKAPAEVRIVTESLPRTESGKIRRAALRG
jgi:acyl-coenzyme A synthetase/AMP-(fatty) acid ligase